jgi:hypothetical protein
VILPKIGSSDDSSISKLAIDTNTMGNELRFIGTAANDKDANIRLVINTFSFLFHINYLQKSVDSEHVIAITNRKIMPGEFLLTNFGGELREKEARYIQMFHRIENFNKETLTEQDQQNSALEWLAKEGFQILKEKGKITIPIENRLPAKQGLAPSLTAKKKLNAAKTQVEWGYVAQMEKIFLERARADCWVTFKAGKHWDGDSFQRALQGTFF